MAEAPVLQQNETSPAIDREQLLKDSQDREFDRLLSSLESDRYTLFDLQDIVIQIWNNNPKAQPYILEFIASRTTQLQQVLMQNKPWRTEKLAEKSTLNISQEQKEKLVKSWETELRSKEQELKQLDQKLIQVDLIRDVASMYKEYLQSIMESIKVKFLTNKPERYKDQIDTISKQVEYLKNLEIYLWTLKNYDELKNLNLTDLVNKMIVSEEKLSQTWFLDQPLWNSMLYHEATVDGVNEWYEDIKKMLLTPNLTREKAEEIKLKIFSKIRKFDALGTDDNWLVLDSWGPISSRIVPNILQNKDLRKRPDINTTFGILENFWDKEKKGLFDSLKWWKENLKTFLTNSKVLEKLWFRNNSDKNDFIDDLYKNLKENLNKINEAQIKKDLETETKNRFDYLIARTPENQQKEVKTQKENALKDENISALVETFKEKAIFTLFEKTVMNRVLENNATYVRNTWFKNEAVNLYRDIEWIWDKISDTTFNNISIFSKTLVEQIAIMYVAWVIWSVAVKWASYGELVASLPTTWIGLKNTAMLWASLSYESLIVYLGYTWANWLINEKEARQLFDKLNNYDLVRNIVFLWVLKNIPMDSMKSIVDPSSKLYNETKRILIDTWALLWTDIIVRASLWELMWKEWIPTDVDWNYTWEKWIDFATDELKSIIPLIIWLRQAEKSVWKLFENGNKPKITVNVTPDEFIINIEWLKKEIRTLRQERNSLRNKWKSTREVSDKLTEKKREYKSARDENGENTINATPNKKEENITPVLQSGTSQRPKEDTSKSKDSNKANDKVNLNTWEKTIQDMLKGNIESVMKWFDVSRQSLSRSFEELLSKWWDKQKAEELISQEVDVRVKQLEKDWVKIDPVEWELFIARFKEERIAEFEQLIKIKEQWGKIPENMKVSYKWREWDLKLRDVKGMNEYFGEYVNKMKRDKDKFDNEWNNL